MLFVLFLFYRQSSTGPGEFVFTTPQSMQIMHGITAMLNEAKRKHGLNVSFRHVPCMCVCMCVRVCVHVCVRVHQGGSTHSRSFDIQLLLLFP